MVIPLGVSQDNGLVLRTAMGISDEVNNFHNILLIFLRIMDRQEVFYQFELFKFDAK